MTQPPPSFLNWDKLVELYDTSPNLNFFLVGDLPDCLILHQIFTKLGHQKSLHLVELVDKPAEWFTSVTVRCVDQIKVKKNMHRWSSRKGPQNKSICFSFFHTELNMKSMFFIVFPLRLHSISRRDAANFANLQVSTPSVK